MQPACLLKSGPVAQVYPYMSTSLVVVVLVLACMGSCLCHLTIVVAQGFAQWLEMDADVLVGCSMLSTSPCSMISSNGVVCCPTSDVTLCAVSVVIEGALAVLRSVHAGQREGVDSLLGTTVSRLASCKACPMHT